MKTTSILKAVYKGMKLFLIFMGIIHIFDLEKPVRNWLFGPPSYVKPDPFYNLPTVTSEGYVWQKCTNKEVVVIKNKGKTP